MKRVEINRRSVMNELNKLNAQLERAEKRLEKKTAIAEKHGVADWTNEQRNAWIETVEKTELGWLINKADQKKNGAWFDMSCAEDEVAELKRRIEKKEARLAEAEAAVEEYVAEVAKIEDLKEKERLAKLEFEQEQKEWAKDGITLNRRYHGTTPSGKAFDVIGNDGYTKRSLHCFTLYIDGETIFTSGEFWRAYAEIKRR